MFEPESGWKEYFKKYDASIITIGVYILLGLGTAFDLDPELYRYFWIGIAGAAGITSGMLIVRLLGWKKYRLPWKFVLFCCAFNWYMMTVVSPAKSNAVPYRLAAVAAVFAALTQWRRMRTRRGK